RSGGSRARPRAAPHAGRAGRAHQRDAHPRGARRARRAHLRLRPPPPAPSGRDRFARAPHGRLRGDRMTDVTTQSPLTLSARLAEFAVATAAELPQRIADDSRDRLIDTVGISIAARDTEPVQAAVALAREWGGNPQATLLGFADRVPAPTAALVNGTAAHALDFDDTHLPSILHPSASAVPAALAAAEVADVDGRTLLAAVAAGNEIAIRLGNAADDPELGNNVFFERGIHATSLSRAIGSAAAAAVALGLDAATTRHALGIAASMGSGILEANRNGGSVKRVHCGWAAHAGVTAAQFARQGITAPDTVLEGRFGFFQAFTGLHPI